MICNIVCNDMVSVNVFCCSSEMDTSTHVESAVAASDHQGEPGMLLHPEVSGARPLHSWLFCTLQFWISADTDIGRYRCRCICGLPTLTLCL